MVVNEDKINNVNKFTTFAGHFDGHGDVPVRWGAHCPMEQVHGYTRCHHWMSPLGKNLHRITPAATMVIDSGVKNRVVALWNRCFKASIQKAHNGSSTQLIGATSYVERLNVRIEAKYLSYLSSYQTLIIDKNVWSFWLPKKLVKS